MVVLGISHTACISSASCESGQQMHRPNSFTHGWLLDPAEKSFCSLCFCICICIYKYFDTVTMLIRQRGPLGIFFVLDHKGMISMFMLTLVSNVVPEYITPPVILCHIIFLSLILGCYSWLCLILWSQQSPIQPICPLARRDKHLIPRYVVPWAMSSSMVMPFSVIPSCLILCTH